MSSKIKIISLVMIFMFILVVQANAAEIGLLKDINIGAGDSFPKLEGKPVSAGEVVLEPASVSFIEFANSNNPACR